MPTNDPKHTIKKTRKIITSSIVAAVIAAQGAAVAAPLLLSSTAAAASPPSATASDAQTGTVITPISPTAGQTVSGSVPVTVKLNDTTNPSSTSFFAGDTLTNSAGTDVTSQAGLGGSLRNNTTGTVNPGGHVYSDVQSSGAKTMLDTTKLPDGQYTLTYTATDGLFGAKSTKTVTFTVNNTPALTGITITNVMPADGSTVSGNVTISAKITANAGQVSPSFGEGFVINGPNGQPKNINGQLTDANGDGVFTSRVLDTTTWANGTYVLTVNADNNHFQSSSKMVTFTVNNAPKDTTAPTINILKPTANSSTTTHVKVSNQKALTFSGTAKDDQTSVSKINLKLYNLTTKKTSYINNQVPVTNGQWSATIPAQKLTDGAHIQVIASGRDAAGNVGVDHAYFYVSDTEPAQQGPTITKIHPANGSTVHGKIKVRAKITASPNGGQVSPTAGEGFVINGPNGQPKNINGQLVDSNGNGVFTSRKLDTTTWANGTYKLTVNAENNMFQESSKTVTFTVNNSSNNGGGGNHGGNGNHNRNNFFRSISRYIRHLVSGLNFNLGNWF
ncbi:MAG: hypothetical protein ACREGA_03710 [Candidatus Saccharimonadales bacterium]